MLIRVIHLYYLYMHCKHIDFETPLLQRETISSKYIIIKNLIVFIWATFVLIITMFHYFLWPNQMYETK